MAETPTRRRFLLAAAALPVAIGGAAGLAAARRGIASLRPRSRGRSASTCAQCGQLGHSMLDPACPAAPKVV